VSQAAPAAATPPLLIGRYALFDELAAGGMATVHLGRLLGPKGFSRTVAVKRLHAHFVKDPEFVTMFMDEARIVSRIVHPNVVSMVDVVQSEAGLFLIMEYVHGESLSRLMRTARKAGEPIPHRVVAAVMSGVLLGLHAAHETKGADGQLLGVVHRDVSPQNVILGADGSARVLDFGIAKAAGRAQITREGQIKGKLAYMSPEQIRGQVDRRTDVFAAAVLLWEMLAGRRLHEGMKEVDIVTRVVKGDFAPPSAFAAQISPEIDAIVLRALAADPNERFASARELALELERVVGLASPSEVSAWVEHLAPEALKERTDLVSAMELSSADLVPIETNPPPAPDPATASPPARDHAPAYEDPSSTASAEVPTSSAAFAHAESRTASAGTQGASRRVGRGTALVLVLSCALALASIALGAYALVQRSKATLPALEPTLATMSSGGAVVVPAGSAASAPPPRTSGELAAPRATTPSATAPKTSGASAGGAPPRTSSAAAPPKLAAATGAVKPSNGGAAPSPPQVAKKAPAKPACDPPYTVDEVGHRHYKPECMGP
jgi:eukaryotic-like serine/threonine-protein kinase